MQTPLCLALLENGFLEEDIKLAAKILQHENKGKTF